MFKSIEKKEKLSSLGRGTIFYSFGRITRSQHAFMSIQRNLLVLLQAFLERGNFLRLPSLWAHKGSWIWTPLLATILLT
ncbi:hypothetical protein CICLE_v10006355mg [Citrus x clementina]|uniref:Uncharacterized protein n=1 Tax=Citrus clementina TaxID=85681 RepID=V4SAM8_CITCL|nr:hypothetical protein CICLE_v10006355mg [Citrus x clementina]